MSRHISRHAKCVSGVDCKGPGCKVSRNVSRTWKVEPLPPASVPDALTFLRTRGNVEES